MRISDWSSDVCSSDLGPAHGVNGGDAVGKGFVRRPFAQQLEQVARSLAVRGEDQGALRIGLEESGEGLRDVAIGGGEGLFCGGLEIGRGSCRERVGQYG